MHGRADGEPHAIRLAGDTVALEIEDRKFALFTKDDSAWARTAELDRAIVAALIKGKNAVVKGVPDKGKPTTDTYSLSGFTKALALIDKACGVQRAETAAALVAPPQKAATPKNRLCCWHSKASSILPAPRKENKLPGPIVMYQTVRL